MKYLFLLLAFLPSWIFAQIQVTIPEPEWKEINSRLVLLKNDSVLLNKQIVDQQDTIKARNDSISSLLKIINSNNIIIHLKDSINNELIKKQKLYEFAEKQILYADTCILKYANAQLYFKYDEKRVANALIALSRVSNKEMKEKQIFENLLSGYKEYIIEIKTLVNNSQNNPDRVNPFNGQQYLSSLKTSLEETSYYRSYYKEGLNIPYLNKIIDTILKLVSNAKPDEGIYADFSSIIEDLQ